MARIRWLLALVGLGLGAADLHAQVLLPGGFGRITYGGIGYSIGRPRTRVAFSFGRAYAGGLGYASGFGLLPLGYTGNRVTVIYTQPALVLAPQPPLFLDDLEQEAKPRPREQVLPPERLPPPPAEPPLPKGDPVGGFRPLAPDNRERARQPLPAPPEKPKPPEQPAPPPPKPPLQRRPDPSLELPRPPQPEANPRAEYARLIDVGRNAFAAGEYGRAAQRFRQATTAAPHESFAHFLLTQALFALGKYADAVDAIHVGLALKPDWPTVRFRPIELYEANGADYADHLRRLDEVVRRQPNDPILLFLYAYELWFDGRQEEARQFLQRALPKAANPGDVQRFLHP